jgi:hypothetical protein
LRPPNAIRRVWEKFTGIPMETFTKGWWYSRCAGAPRQRTIADMVQHRRTQGSGGNCFDLALWLRHELHLAGVPARIVGHDLCTPEAHVAVIAADEGGSRYLCDLGDQWLQPILIDPGSDGFSDGWHVGFFPGREVRICRADDQLEVLYRRTNGKVGSQRFDLRPLAEDEVQQACHHSQNLLRRPFCEILLPHSVTGLVEHWEYDNGASFWNLAEGPVFEEPCSAEGEWVSRIAGRTGMSKDLIYTAFAVHRGGSLA